MSLITHPCTECGHPDFWRRTGPKGALTGRCGNPPSCYCSCKPGAPEVRPTFDLAHKPVERIVPPGELLTLGVPTCGCDDCKALYAGLTAGSS